MSRVFQLAQLNSIVTPPNPVYNNLRNITIAFWYYALPGNNDSQDVVLVKDPAGSYAPNIDIASSLYIDRTFFVYFGDFSTWAENTTPIPLNAWSHVAFTWNQAGDNLPHIFINGVEDSYVTQQPVVNPADDSGGGYSIGDDQTGFSLCAPFNMAELAIFNTSLSASQIATLAASTSGVPGSLPAPVGYWHLCGLMSPEPDASGNGDDGVLIADPAQGPVSPGFSCSTMPTPYSVPDCRDYGNFPNDSVDVNGTLTYTVPSVDSRAAGAPVDSRAAGAPVACGTYPQNSRTPGTFGPGE